MDRLSRDQPQPGSLFQRLREVEKRDPGKEVGFSATSSGCLQNLKYENSTSSFGRLRQNIARKSVPHVQYDYFSSFNQSNR